jgi:CubicO group peptidase (beta-lactamase class C family)
MAESHHRAPRRLARVRRALAGAVLGALLVATGCATPPSPSPTEIMDEELASVFDVVYGEETVRAIIIQQHGEPVYERYVDAVPGDTWDIRGVTRIVTSTLIGIAIDRGLIRGVDATLGELLPAYAGVLTPDTAAIPLKSVLTHTAGLPLRVGTAATAAPDWIAAILAERTARDPVGGRVLPSDAGAHILAAVITQATGMSVLQFAQQALFDPLGIDSDPLWEQRLSSVADLPSLVPPYDDAEVAWPADPQGVNLGYSHLRLRPTDLLRIGELYLDEGAWDDTQVVSPTWAVEATSALVATRDIGTTSYGYQWWVDRPRQVYYAQGDGGTALVVDRSRDAVAVVVSEVTADDARGTVGLTPSTAAGLAIVLIRNLPDPSE